MKNRNEKLFEAIGDISDDTLAIADNHRESAKPRKVIWRLWTPVAAAVLVVAISAGLMLHFLAPESPNDPIASDTSGVSEHPSPAPLYLDEAGNRAMTVLSPEREAQMLHDYARYLTEMQGREPPADLAYLEELQEELYVYGYYGTFNGNSVVTIWGRYWAAQQALGGWSADGYAVVQTDSSSIIGMVYDGETFVPIQEAYEQGMFSAADVRTMAFWQIRREYAAHLPHLYDIEAAFDDVVIYGYYDHRFAALGFRNPDPAKQIEAAGFTFDLPSGSRNIYALGHFYDIESGYEQGWLAFEEIEQLYERHFRRAPEPPAPDPVPTPGIRRGSTASAAWIYEQTDMRIRIYTIHEGWVYYTFGDGWLTEAEHINGIALYRIRVDGSGGMRIADVAPHYLHVEDGWIYFTSSGVRIERMRTDGSQRTVLRTYNVPLAMRITVQDGWIYYAHPQQERHTYRMRTDGSERSRISDGSNFREHWGFVIHEDWIYFSGGDIIKMRTDGSDITWFVPVNSEGISPVSAGSMWNMFIADGHLYFNGGMRNDLDADGNIIPEINQDPNYPGDTFGFFRISIDCDCIADPGYYFGLLCVGERNPTMIRARETYPLHTEDGWIYFAEESANHHNNVVLYRMRLDGSQVTRLGQESWFGYQGTMFFFGGDTIIFREPPTFIDRDPDHVCENELCMACYTGYMDSFGGEWRFLEVPGEIYRTGVEPGSSRTPMMFFVEGITDAG
jgi:hypothetical protein